MMLWNETWVKVHPSSCGRWWWCICFTRNVWIKKLLNFKILCSGCKVLPKGFSFPWIEVLPEYLEMQYIFDIQKIERQKDRKTERQNDKMIKGQTYKKDKIIKRTKRFLFSLKRNAARIPLATHAIYSERKEDQMFWKENNKIIWICTNFQITDIIEIAKAPQHF